MLSRESRSEYPLQETVEYIDMHAYIYNGQCSQAKLESDVQKNDISHCVKQSLTLILKLEQMY